MRRLLLLVATLAFVPCMRIRGQTPFAGLWQGALTMNGVRARLGFEIKQDSAGRLTGVMTSIDEGGIKIPGGVALAGDTLVMTMPMAVAQYRATLDRDSLRGTFTLGAGRFPLKLGRTSEITTVLHPQEPKPPFPYRAEDVTVESVAGVRLGCTLDLPQGEGPFPAAVMATGSGPQNRNEAMLGHNPFLVIADYLARRGVATLRCDDRGFGASTGNYAAASAADFADDAEAGVKYLRTRDKIAPNKIGIIGHSEGGMIGPMVAARSRDVAFVVMMAGPGIRGDSLWVLQGQLIAKAAGASPEAVERLRLERRAVLGAILAARDSADAEARERRVEDSLVASRPEAQRPLARRQFAMSHPQIMSNELQSIFKYDPHLVLAQVNVPVLALNGTLDLQVPYAEDLAGIESALKAAGNHDVTTVALPGLNHLFQPATTGSPSEYAAIETTIAPVALETMTDWIVKRFGK